MSGKNTIRNSIKLERNGHVNISNIEDGATIALDMFMHLEYIFMKNRFKEKQHGKFTN
jgi:hypothetical protein